ncbi:MAG: hypothetical protein ACQEXV_23905 [Bacillota bacterium]
MAINKKVNRIVGFEAANSYVKYRTVDASDVYFNSLWRIPEVGYEAAILGGEDSPNIFGIDGENFYAGTRRKGYMTSSSRDMERYSSDEYRRESLIALAHVANPGEALSVVTAIPGDHYNNKDEVERIITETLRGKTGVVNMEVNAEPLSFGILKVKTLLQPAATVIGVALDEKGNVRKAYESLTTDYKIVIDIGWGTTDIAIMDGMTVIKAVTVEKSMMNAYERIDEKLKRDNPELRSMNYKLFDLEKDLREGDIFEKGGKPYDCTEIKAEAFEWVAGEMMTEIANIVKLKDADAAIYTGGGVIPLRPYLKRYTDGVNAMLVDDPQGANARGCYVYGVAMK